jgi:hypothetical protein
MNNVLPRGKICTFPSVLSYPASAPTPQRTPECLRKPGHRVFHAGALSSCSSGIVPVDRDDATVLSPATRVVRCAVSRIVRGHAFPGFRNTKDVCPL